MSPQTGAPLSHSRRLHYRWEFRRFFGQSDCVRLPLCTIFRVANSLGHFRLGVTLKARPLSSVERNQIKRVVREALRRLGPELGSFDYNVVIPLSFKPTRESLRGLREDLTERLRRSLRTQTA